MSFGSDVGSLYSGMIPPTTEAFLAQHVLGQARSATVTQSLTPSNDRALPLCPAVVQVAPEVLPVAVPVFVLQPLVENAVRHGLEKKPGQGHITIVASDAGPEAHITVEDDGGGTVSGLEDACRLP